MVFKCLVKGCENSHLTTKMHMLPRDPERFRLWSQLIDRSDLSLEKIRIYRVCDIHFSDDQKFPASHNRTNLKANAVPDFLLPEAEGATSRKYVADIDNPMPGTSTESTFCSSSNQELDAIQQGTKRQGSPLTPPASKLRSESISPRTPKLVKNVDHRINLLALGKLRHKKELTPKSHKFYKVAKGILNSARKLFQENASNKERLEEALNMVEGANFFKDKVNNTTLKFIESQLKLQSKKGKGRRFTLDDKIFGLSLLKQSPRCYRLLQRTFALPSRKTLMSLLYKIPFDCGINRHILFSLSKSLENMDPLDRSCCLLFDEMWLEAALTYNQKEDNIIGFQHIEKKQPRFADHVLVFMARGIRKKWKQPVCYYLSDGGMTSQQLTLVIREVITSLQEIGLKVVATICDQLPANSAAINNLKSVTSDELRTQNQENRMYGFCIGGEEIIPLFDPPHLLKGLRNNMLEGKVKFVWRQNKEQTASWEDVVALYELDVGDHDTRMLNRLTNEHVYKDHIKKMKVKNAAQVFSQRVSSIMRGIVRLGNGQLPNSAMDTADFLLFVDKVFDSVNGSVINADYGKTLRCAVKPNSPHVEFWYEAVKVFTTVKFVTDKRQYIPPTIKNWILTLRGFIYLWRILQDRGFNFLCPRNLNQDPLENFFGCIRSHGVRNVNPTCSSMVTSFKSLLVNNFASPHSPGANCEQDETEGALDSLRYFLSGDVPTEAYPSDEHHTDFEPDPNFKFTDGSDPLIISTHAYIAGFLAKTILKLVGPCVNCRSDLLSTFTQPEHHLIDYRAYSSKALLRPNTQFIMYYTKCNDVLHHYLPSLCTENKIKERLSHLLFKHISFDKFTCSSHNLPVLFANKFVLFYIYSWIKNVNQILKGIRSNQINDAIKSAAAERHRKYKTKKAKIQALKRLT